MNKGEEKKKFGYVFSRIFNLLQLTHVPPLGVCVWRWVCFWFDQETEYILIKEKCKKIIFFYNFSI